VFVLIIENSLRGSVFEAKGRGSGLRALRSVVFEAGKEVRREKRERGVPEDRRRRAEDR
jgi:hypothetical protein